MLKDNHGLRPQVEPFECLGGRVEMIDIAAILRQAGREPMQLLHAPALPAPIDTISISVAADMRGTEGMHFLKAVILIGGAHGPRALPSSVNSGLTVPSLLLVANGLRVGGPLGAVAAGLMVIGAHTFSRVFRPAPEDAEPAEVVPAEVEPAGVQPADPADLPPVEVTDDRTGLRAAVTYEKPPAAATGKPGLPAIVVRAGVPSRVVQSAHIRAFFDMVLQVAQHHAGRAGDSRFLSGRSFSLSRYPHGHRVDPAAADTVTLDQVGGLSEVVSQLREVALSFNHPAVMARWGARRPQGILLYGPPGTGKTMLARALASEIGGTMREIRTPDILNKYVGESERNIKQIFQEARRYTKPTVLFFDEFDSIISYTGAGFDAASQVFNGVAGIFKQEMNTLIDENPNVIVVATTNFPQRVDQSLIRSGRFDIKITVPLPDNTARADIIIKMIRALIGRHEVSGFRMFADDVDAEELAQLTDGMTGADFKEVLRRVQLAKAMEEARGNRRSAPITQDDLKRCIADMRRGPLGVTHR